MAFDSSGEFQDLFNMNEETRDGLTETVGHFFAIDKEGGLLGGAIPARSYALASNPFTEDATNIIDIQMDKTLNSNGSTQNWPSTRKRAEGERNPNKDKLQWKHSDFRNVAYLYVFDVFDEFVIKGDLKND